MSDKLALYKCDWMRVLADVGLGEVDISRAIELAKLNGLFDPIEAAHNIMMLPVVRIERCDTQSIDAEFASTKPGDVVYIPTR